MSDLGGRDQETSVNWGSREQQPQCSGANEEPRDQVLPAPRQGKIAKAKPNSARKGHTSLPTVIFKYSLLHGAILHPPSVLIRPDLQMSALFQQSQHNCHI